VLFRPFLLISIFLIPLLISCAQLAPKLVGEPVSRDFTDALMRDWYQSSEQNESMSGLAKFEMVTPERSMSGNQVLLIEKPDRLRAEVLSLFGSPLLLLAADGEELDVLLPFENEFYTGSASPENLGRFVRLPLQLKDLVKILLYQPPMIAAERVAGYDLNGDGWLVERQNPPYRQELFFDAQKRLVEVNYYNRSGLSLAIEYGKFSDEDPMPQQFEIRFPRHETTASLKFSDLEVNGKLDPNLFQLTIPRGAEVISLEEQ
jgi:hypothetical protein